MTVIDSNTAPTSKPIRKGDTVLMLGLIFGIMLTQAIFSPGGGSGSS